MYEKSTEAEQQLEDVSSHLLSKVDAGHGEYPAYSEKVLTRKIAKDIKYISKNPANSISYIDESSILIQEIIKDSNLSLLERTILDLLMIGMTQEEIAEVLCISRRTTQNKIYTIRKKIEDVPNWFWEKGSDNSFYHRPSGCCNPGMEECRKDGICPYHKTFIK